MKDYSCKSFLWFLFVCNFVFSQTEQLNKQYYKSFDSVNNYQNIEVYNGFEYIDTYLSLKRDNHKFYHDVNGLVGDVIFNGQPYFGYKMKYDLLNDFLVLEFINHKINFVQLVPEHVNKFVLDNDTFIRLPMCQELEGFYRNGYFKEVYEAKSYTLYLKYIKLKNQKFRENKIYYVFSDLKIYVLQYQNKFYRINKLEDVVDIFPLKKNHIKYFYKNYKELYKRDKEQFLQNLFKNLNNLLADNVNE